MTPARPARRRRWPRLDLLSILLAPLGVGVIVAAQWIEGSPLSALVQGPSALIVFGGTLGAVLISYRPFEIAGAAGAAARAFQRTEDDTDRLAATIVALSIRAHRRGVPALESDVDAVEDPMLRAGLSLVIDGAPVDTVNDVLAIEQRVQDDAEDLPARIFEAAAGYAPTMGILGAVLGLIQVMEHLEAPGALGSGIALAFVATVYGVGLANLVLLPVAGRLRERAAQRARRRDVIVYGLHAIQDRLNPRLVAQKLRVYSTRLPRIEELAAHAAPVRARTPGISA